MKSSILNCSVRHTRLWPKRYQFNFKFFLFSIYLEEIEELKKIKFLGINRFNLFYFKDKDYLPHNGESLKQRIDNFLKKNNINDKIISIRLITTLRTFGYIFNPVSYYIIETKKEKHCIIEINNTFKEVKSYFVSNENINSNTINYITTKNFYISPFISAQNKMHFKIVLKDENISIKINDYKIDGELELVTDLSGNSTPLSSKNIIYNSIRYPLISYQITFFIHLHALILLIKRIPYFKKNNEQEYQKEYHSWK